MSSSSWRLWISSSSTYVGVSSIIVRSLSSSSLSSSSVWMIYTSFIMFSYSCFYTFCLMISSSYLSGSGASSCIIYGSSTSTSRADSLRKLGTTLSGTTASVLGGMLAVGGAITGGSSSSSESEDDSSSLHSSHSASPYANAYYSISKAFSIFFCSISIFLLTSSRIAGSTLPVF